MISNKKQRRTVEVRSKKNKKTVRKSVLILLLAVTIGFLVFFFLTLFDYVYPPVDGKSAKKKEKTQVVLYFSDANERFLVPETRFVSKEDRTTTQAREIVRGLLDGSRTGLVNTFPDKVDVLGVRVDDGTAFVNFGKNLQKNHPGGTASEMATIYSLANTLTKNLPEIKRVKILIAGKEVATLKGHVDTRQPFAPNPELVRGSAKQE